MSTLQETVEHLNALLTSFDECHIFSFDGSRLIIIGDWDLGYHHNFEAQFVDVSFIQCATSFNAQVFRLATALEREQLRLINYTDAQDALFCFESDGHQFFIAAQSLGLREGLVLHNKPNF